MIAMLLGKQAKNLYKGMFENFKAYDETMKFPTLENLKTQWNKTSALLKEAFVSTTEEIIDADSPLKSPIGDSTNAGTIAFLVQHESYDIGQIGFLKKYHTK
jgi:hypothetical protein